MAIRRAERFRRLALGFALAPLFTAGVAFVTGDVVLARQGCVTGFDPQVLNVSAAGNSDAVNPPPSVRVLTATSVCQWSFSNPPIPSWMAFFPTAAPGPFTISFSVQPNMDMSPRSAVLMFDGRPLTVTQAGNPCPLTLSSAGTLMPANGGQASFTVNTPGTSCTYSVAASAGVTIVSGSSGSTYPATVTFSVPPNTTGSQTLRIVQVSIVGQAVFAPVFNILQRRAARGDRCAVGRIRVCDSPRPVRGPSRDCAGVDPDHEQREPDGVVDRDGERAMARGVPRVRNQPVDGVSSLSIPRPPQC